MSTSKQYSNLLSRGHRDADCDELRNTRNLPRRTWRILRAIMTADSTTFMTTQKINRLINQNTDQDTLLTSTKRLHVAPAYQPRYSDCQVLLTRQLTKSSPTLSSEQRSVNAKAPKPRDQTRSPQLSFEIFQMLTKTISYKPSTLSGQINYLSVISGRRAI